MHDWLLVLRRAAGWDEWSEEDQLISLLWDIYEERGCWSENRSIKSVFKGALTIQLEPFNNVPRSIFLIYISHLCLFSFVCLYVCPKFTLR